MELKNKVAVVTGAAQGIGKVIALFLARKGAAVVVCDINLEMAEETAREIEDGGGRCLALKSDVSNYEEAEKIIKESVAQLGSLDILVNNAGITKDNILIRMKDDQWDQVMAVNLKGTFNFTKAVAREYADRGITVNAVAPGFIATAMTDAIPEREKEELTKQIPMKKLGTPEDVASAVYFLASDDAGYITGQVIGVNGGMYM